MYKDVCGLGYAPTYHIRCIELLPLIVVNLAPGLRHSYIIKEHLRNGDNFQEGGTEEAKT